jgi:hypothetical protein
MMMMMMIISNIVCMYLFMKPQVTKIQWQTVWLSMLINQLKNHTELEN